MIHLFIWRRALFLSIILQQILCQEELICSKPTDLAILLDSTDAQTDSKWQNVLSFTSKLVDAYSIGPSETKVSIATFGGVKSKSVLAFDTLKGSNLTMEKIKERVSAIPHDRVQARYIDKALQFADKEMFTTANGMRDDPNVLRVLVVFIAGKQSPGPSISLRQATRGLRLKAVDIFAIAVPNVADVDEDDLYEIATSTESVMTSKTYQESVTLAEDVAKMACGIKILEMLESDWKNIPNNTRTLYA